MKKSRFMVLFLILAIMAGLFLSCNGDTTKDTDDSNQAQTAENETENEGENIAAESNDHEDDLPEMDFQGEPFRMVHMTEYTNAHAYLLTEEENGDVINDSIYKANKIVEERFNTVFVEAFNAGNNFGDFPGLLKKAVSAGDNAYDYFLMADRDAFALAMEGKYFHTVAELPHINLDKAYWSQEMNKGLSIENTLYFAYGANMLSVYDFASFLLFNKKIVEELALDNIYQSVREGKWTIDKMTEMCRAAVADLDGDGKMTDNDRYGASIRGDYFYASFWVCNHVPMIAKDKNDLPYFNVPGNEALFDIFAKLHEMSTDNYIWNSNGGTDPAMEMFSKGNALFFSSTTYTTLRLRGMEIDYGIIPYPSVEQKQANEPYSARAQSGFPVLIPVLSDPVRGSAIMEALACQYEKHVLPVYYNNAVQVKATRDEESIEMIDMLLSNMYFELGDTLWAINLRNEYVNLFVNRRGNTVQSLTESITPSMEDILQTAIDSFKTAGE